MDDGRGRFQPVPDAMPPLEIESRATTLRGIFAIGDTVELRGSRFRVHDIKPNGRLALKLLPREPGAALELPHHVGPGKVAIRDEGAFVVAYLSTLDGKEREELGRIHGMLIRTVPGAFDTWKQAMKTIGFSLIETATGVKVLGSHELPPAMLEERGGGDA